MVRDAEDFARRRPALVITGAAITGLLAARFVGASSRRRYAEGAASEPPARPALAAVPRAGESGGPRNGPVAVSTPYETRIREA